MLTKDELNSEEAKRIYKAIGRRYDKDFRLLSVVVKKKDYAKYDLRSSSFEKNADEMTITESLKLNGKDKQVAAVAKKTTGGRAIDISLFISKREGLADKLVGVVDYWYADGVVIVTRVLDTEDLQAMKKFEKPVKPQVPVKRRKLPMLFARNRV